MHSANSVTLNIHCISEGVLDVCFNMYYTLLCNILCLYYSCGKVYSC